MNSVLSILEDIVRNNIVVGISVSGGLDSTLLAYLLHDLKYKLDSGVQFKFFCVDRPDDSITHARRIVDYIDKCFNQSHSKIYIVGDGTLHHAEQVKSGMREAISQYGLDLLVTGVTKNPDELLPNYVYDSFKDLDGTIYNGPVRVKPQNPKFVNPFWDVTKQETVKLIKDMALIELPNITHTCTGSRTTRCNRCWQCCERAWAFLKNDYIDTGTM